MLLLYNFMCTARSHAAARSYTMKTPLRRNFFTSTRNHLTFLLSLINPYLHHLQASYG